MSVIPFTCPDRTRVCYDNLEDLEDGLDLLEITAQTLPLSGPLNLEQIAQDLGQSLDEIRRLANILVARDYITREQTDSDITLTRKLFDLSLARLCASHG